MVLNRFVRFVVLTVPNFTLVGSDSVDRPGCTAGPSLAIEADARHVPKRKQKEQSELPNVTRVNGHEPKIL